MQSAQGPRPPRRFLRHGTMLQLAAFEAVVRLGSATRAAESLCMAQPTLSRHLRKLSETLGVRLFELQGKRLIPTDAAMVLLHAAHEVFAAFERCEEPLAHLRLAGQAETHSRLDNRYALGGALMESGSADHPLLDWRTPE